MHLIKSAVVLILVAACPGCSGAEVNADAQRAVQEGTHALLAAISERDISEIVEFIGEGGIEDSDIVVPREKIESDLHDPQSHLYKQLFSEITSDDLDVCRKKLEGKILASPRAFIEEYGDHYSVLAERIEEFEGLKFGVVVKASPSVVGDCELQLFPARMRIENGKVFLSSYFFE